MKPFEKNYLECRFFLIGDREVGKKSFIERLLSIPSTSVIRNVKAEESFKREIHKLLKENELSDVDYYNSLSNYTLNSSSKEKTNTLKNITFKNIETKHQNQKTRNVKFKARFDHTTDTLEEKKNKIVMKSLVKYQVMSSRFTRPPIPEYPSKLFNVNKSKIVIKPFYIFPGEETSDFYLNEENAETEYFLDSNPKINIKGVITDLFNLKNNKATILNIDKLTGYNINIYNFFIFLYDLSNFNSFELMKKYFEKIITKFNISNLEDNCITCIIGNKKDKKSKFDKEQEIQFNEFVKQYNNLYLMEISTKPYFNFNKFFYELFFSVLGKYHGKLFSEADFRTNFESISLNKTTFSKGLRKTYDPYQDNPGPIYNINTLYRYISPTELIEAFHNKKKRFNQKIFANKLGPVFGEEKSTKDLLRKTKLKFLTVNQPSGGVLNKTPKGFSFGTVDGKLNLFKTRKDILFEINKNIRESVEGSCTLYNISPRSKSKEQDYFDSAQERKEQFLIEKNNKNKEKTEKNLENNKNNLKKLEEKNEQKRDLLRQKLHLFKSSSTPDMLQLSNKNKTDLDFYKERLTNILYPNNRSNLSKFNKTRNFILKNMPIPQTPGPNAYNVSNNILDPKKGPYILGRRPLIEFPRADPQFLSFKDEFEQIVLKAQKTAGIEKFFRPRFRELIKEIDTGPYNDLKVWEKWENNKKHLKGSGRIKKFLDYRKEKFKAQKENKIGIENEKKEIEKITRAISVQKGHGDPAEIKAINYSLVEDSSPKYTIKGRNLPRTKTLDDLGNMFLNESEEVINAILNEQMTRPLPDFNYIRPRLPGIIFPRAERFNKTRDYEGSELLFTNGIFSPKTHEDFFKKEPFSNKAQRNIFLKNKEISPSPAEYKIKSSFEIIAEKGKKKSENKDENKNKENNIHYRMIHYNKNKKNKDLLDIRGINDENNKEKESRASSNMMTMNIN